MGSLPDLTERGRASPGSTRPAARTLSDPNRNKIQQPQAAPSIVQVKEWRWKRAPRAPPAAPRRRDSATSSVGAASVRRLLRRAPPRPPHAIGTFAALCVARALSAAAVLPLTALVGAEDSVALFLMHGTAALLAPAAPYALRKVGSRLIVSGGQTILCLLLCAHALGAPQVVSLPLYCLAGAVLGPLSLAYTAAATATAHALSVDDARKKVVLRRALRALRGAKDAGLLAGALVLGAALTIWPGEPPVLNLATPTNRSLTRWPPPPDDYFIDEDFEEKTCGASGCPGDATAQALTSLGRRTLFTTWSILTLVSVALGTIGAASKPPAPASELAAPIKPTFSDARWTLEVPMALFIGLQEGFIYTSYVKWYAVCVGGWGAAWSALAGTGALQALAAATLSMAAARGRRGALAAGGAAAHACLLLALLRWRAARTDQALPAVAAAAWGACGALWDTLQTAAVVGGPSWRASWSFLLSARHVGVAAACSARQLLCVRTQLGILAVTLIFAISTHAAKEIKNRRASSNERASRQP